MAFEYVLTARFHEVDQAGILFFGRFFEYAHICFEEMLNEGFGGFAELFEVKRFGMPLVHAEASFRAPVRGGDQLILRLRIDTLSERSVLFACDICGARRDDDLRATVWLKHAFVRFPELKGCSRPQFLDDGFRRLGLLTDSP